MVTRELAVKHWKYSQKIIREAFRIGHKMASSGLEWETIFEVVQPLLETLYVEAMVHGIKHGKEDY